MVDFQQSRTELLFFFYQFCRLDCISCSNSKIVAYMCYNKFNEGRLQSEKHFKRNCRYAIDAGNYPRR